MPVAAAATVDPDDPRWLDWGGTGSPLHFAHANGFPPETYRVLLGALGEGFSVHSTAARPLWGEAPPNDLRDWRPLARDLAEMLEKRGLRGVVGAGHSLGAVTSLLAAADDPGLFKAVIAIDPLALTGLRSVAWRLMKQLGIGDRLPLVRGAKRRRDRWSGRRAIRAAYRHRTAFADWQADVFEDYLEAGFTHIPGGGLQLRYPRSWEAAVFEAAPHDLWSVIARVRVPLLLIQGAHSDTFTDASRARLRRVAPDARVAVVPGTGHFVPMERPAEVARIMMEFRSSLASERGTL